MIDRCHAVLLSRYNVYGVLNTFKTFAVSNKDRTNVVQSVYMKLIQNLPTVLLYRVLFCLSEPTAYSLL